MNRANRNFVQVYDKGWDRIAELINDYPLAARVYTFIAKHCDTKGALVISQELLGKKLNVTSRSIRTATKYLADNNIIPRFKIGGNTYLYALNPDEIWKSWNSAKDYAVFEAIVMIDKNNEEHIKQIKSLFSIPNSN